MRRCMAMAAVGGLLVLSACSSRDDGGVVRSDPSQTGGGSALSGSDLGSQSADKDITAATTKYRTYVLSEAAALRVATKKFTDAVRAGDVSQAKAQFAPSRVSWERIEPIAGLVEETDGVVDSRVDDFASAEDPKWTGWHRLEYLLWEKNTTSGGAALATRLDADLATLETQLKTKDITPKAVALGAQALIEEVSTGKIDGEEDRYSHTDLSDFAANVEGSKFAYGVFKPILTTKDKALATALDSDFAAVQASLKPYQASGNTYKPYSTLTAPDKRRMQSQLATLAEDLAKVPGTLNL